MLLGEFETHTDIFPDVLYYECAEHEYNTGDWSSKAQFCHAVKFDEDGLAHKIQRLANEKWIAVNEECSRLRESVKPLTDKCEMLTAENNRLEDENENLRNELAQLADRVDELNDEILEVPRNPQGFTTEKIRAAMQQALTDAACDDNKADMILHSVWAFSYLMERLGGK